MAKFSVFLRDESLFSALFKSGVIHIGRDESNDLAIDSLAFAPAHAAVIVRDNETIIKQLNANFPLIINGKRHNKHRLKNGDIITVGKHQIIYNPDENKTTLAQPNSKATDLNNSSKHIEQPAASLQIMTGKHIGHIIPLNKSMTRMGHQGSGIIVITLRKEGYFVSVLEANDRIKLNNTLLASHSIQLKNNDIILLNDIPIQFIWIK
ncbi:FHA domain-containing protein [Methyloprofundus sp.]|uniref:FHA domain-containing protein n=1 Tax=Methyloprofundus sp. TaxID=2020875 RepID=UPI003D0DF356